MKIRDIADAHIPLAESCADQWASIGDDFTTVRTALESLSGFPEWTGAACGAMTQTVTATADRVGTAASSAQTVGSLLDAHCAALTTIQAAVRSTIALAESAGMTVHSDGLVTAGGGGLAGAVLDGMAAGATAILQGAMVAVRTLDAALAGTVAVGTSVEDTPTFISGDLGALADAVHLDEALAASMTPETRAAVWELATDAAQELMDRGLDPTELGVHVTEMNGELAVTIGDIDTADKVTTLVSGTGSSSLGGLRESSLLAARITNPGQATIAWHGYDAPASLPAASRNGNARRGGTELRGVQENLRTRNPDARLSIVGHSYGTRVIDEGAGDSSRALQADEIHLMGSPGMTALTADQLHLDALDGDAEVHVYRAPGDIIGAVTDNSLIHGRDPADLGWGADFINGTAPEDHSVPEKLDRWLLNGSGKDAADLAATLWGLADGDVGDEHSGYRTDEGVLEALRK
ncbi:alpha/beta hydrolase [Corynebacterium terpenotabidum]|uniref:DUF1023 domain-containing protein n=1 Tax=Corynebacterium terpenotabidum Y-11 TaxID=1200352 RepID=S4XBI0_9CORY|nr:alpha/beta hydrolase [Corynebacterium terpenotabidum]AGP29941.1 hypothetical protein A606_01430 [Corynebacterium terpenotabidum Y-11]